MAGREKKSATSWLRTYPDAPSKMVGATMAVSAWLNSREIFAAAALIVLSLVIGILGGTLLLSVLVAVLVLSIASCVWAIRTGAEQNSESQQHLRDELLHFRQDLRQVHEVLGHMATLQDPVALDALARITKSVADARENRLLFDVVRRDVSSLATRLSDLDGRGSYSVWARRTEVDVYELLQTYVDSLDAGWKHYSVTDLRFWSSATLLRPGDFIDTHAEAAQRGAKIYQLFVIPARARVDEDQLSTLIAHWELSSSHPNVETHVISPPSHDAWARAGNFAVCVPPNGTDSVLLEMHFGQPVADSDGGFERLEVVTQKERIGRRHRRFERSLAKSTPIEEFLMAIVPDLMPATLMAGSAEPDTLGYVTSH